MLYVHGFIFSQKKKKEKNSNNNNVIAIHTFEAPTTIVCPTTAIKPSIWTPKSLKKKKNVGDNTVKLKVSKT